MWHYWQIGDGGVFWIVNVFGETYWNFVMEIWCHALLSRIRQVGCQKILSGGMILSPLGRPMMVLSPALVKG